MFVYAEDARMPTAPSLRAAAMRELKGGDAPKLAETGSACDHLRQPDMTAAMRNTASTGFGFDAAHLLFCFRPCVTHAIASASRYESQQHELHSLSLRELLQQLRESASEKRGVGCSQVVLAGWQRLQLVVSHV